MTSATMTPSPPDRHTAACPYPWSPDQGDGTYRNPIVCADYSDPDAVRVGDDFYLTSSSFCSTPGLPILHSRDLVNWTLIGHALRRLPDPRYAEVQPGCGVWAPAIRHHAGKFWIFFPTPDEGIYLTTAADPAGPWTEPHRVQEGKGLIDPCPYWDDDGQAYLAHAYAGSRSGIRHVLRVRPMAPDGSRLLGEGKIVFHAPERHPTIEGPKFLKRDGWYYLLAPAGGVTAGWQVALRSRHIYGPYEDRVILHQGRTAINGPHQGALLDLPNGEWWFLHFQDAGLYGRILHLQPVAWKDGWPVAGEDREGQGVGEPVLHWRKPAVPGPSPAAIPQTTDEFDSADLGWQWQWQANHEADWCSLSARRGWLRLLARPSQAATLDQAPNVLLQKFPAYSFLAETFLDSGGLGRETEAGLVVIGGTTAAIGLRRTAQTDQVVFRNGGAPQVLKSGPGHSLRLRVRVETGGRCTFGFSGAAGEFTDMAEAFQAEAGKWVGARVGLYAVGHDPGPYGHADFDYLRFHCCSR
jgi:beta-xylosidase